MPDTINVPSVDLVLSESLSLALLNAVNHQQTSGIAAAAAATMSAMAILSLGAAEAGAAARAAAKSAAAADSAAGPKPLALSREAAAPTAYLSTVGGPEMALQFVAQSVALSVQDAVDSVRNVSTICTAAIGATLVRMQTGGDAKSLAEEIQLIQEILAKATASLQATWKEAAAFLAQAPHRESSATEADTPLSAAVAQAIANAAHNAVTAQQQTNITAQAATTMGVATLYSLDTAAAGIATKAVSSGD